jgi:hypothetical protein
LRTASGGNIAKAEIWALVPATLSAIWWVPQIYLWHLIWGLNLGLIYNPLPAEG